MSYREIPIRRTDLIARPVVNTNDESLCGACPYCDILTRYCLLTDTQLSMTGKYPNSRYVRSEACVQTTAEPGREP